MNDDVNKHPRLIIHPERYLLLLRELGVRVTYLAESPGAHAGHEAAIVTFAVSADPDVDIGDFRVEPAP